MNPFEKFLGPEDKLQKAIINYLSAQYPQAIVAHPPNEGRRSKFEQFKIKYLGVSAGLPDLLVFNHRAPHYGLAIEVKAPGNKPTDRQRNWLTLLASIGWRSTWVNSFDQAKDVIDDYFNPGAVFNNS